MWKQYFISGFLFITLCMGCVGPRPGEKPETDNPVLFSINPNKVRGGDPANTFHGYPVLGQLTVEGDDKQALIEALAKGLADKPKSPAKCFIPRHGLRFTDG